MSQHVDIILNRWFAAEQLRLATVTVTSEDPFWPERLLRPIVTQYGQGDYITCTDIHDDDGCLFAASDTLPMRTVTARP